MLTGRAPMTHATPSRLETFVAHPGRALFNLSLPMIAGFTVHALYTVVDSVFIGRLGPEALAASGYISSIFYISIALTNGLATGITANVAQSYGAKNIAAIDEYGGTGLTLSVLISIVLGIATILAGPALIPLLGAEGASISLAFDYMAPLFAGMPLFFIATALRSMLNGKGDAKRPMIALAVSTLINVALDPLFMFTFGMGIRGAAVATLVAQTVATVMLAWMVFSQQSLKDFLKHHLALRAQRLLDIVRLAVPATAGQLVMAMGMSAINRSVSAYGQTAMAGYVAGNRIDMCVSLPIMGIASAAMTLTGIFAGAARSDLVRRTTINAYGAALICAVSLGSLSYAFAPSLIAIFTKDAHTLQIGTQYLRWVAFYYPLMAVGMTTGRILQGLGFGCPTLIITALRVQGIGVTGDFISTFVLHWPVTGVWASFIAGGFGALLLSIYYVRRYLWRQTLVPFRDNAEAADSEPAAPLEARGLVDEHR